MQKENSLQHKYWSFIEDGDLDWPSATPEEQIYFREVAAAFLRAAFEPPVGYVIDVLEAQHNQSRFPVIALGWNHEPEPLSLNERLEFIRRMVEPLRRFVHAVDWAEISRIKTSIENTPGLEDLKRLLQKHDTLPLARRCLEALSDSATTIHLAPRSLAAAELRDIHAKRAVVDAEQNRLIESSDSLLSVLMRMADAGEQVCVHLVTTKKECFSVVTDAAIQQLGVIQAGHDAPYGIPGPLYTVEPRD